MGAGGSWGMTDLGFLGLLGAVVILMVGGGLLARVVPARYRHGGAVLVALGSLAAVAWPKPAASGVISAWEPLALFGSPLAYHADGLAHPFARLLALLVLALACSLAGRVGRSEGHLYAALFLPLAAALSFVFSANLITLSLSWVLLDLALCLGAALSGDGGATRSLAANYLAGLALLVAVLLAGEPGQQLFLWAEPLPERVLPLLLIAALVRAGFYPFHAGLAMGDGRRPEVRAALLLAPAVAGLYLLARLTTLFGGQPVGVEVFTTLAAASTLASAVLAWLREREAVWPWLVINGVGSAFVLWTASGGGEAAVVLWPAANLILALGVLFVERRAAVSLTGHDGERLARLAAPGLAVASLLGLPFTLGFAARWTCYRLVPWPTLALLVLADTFLFAALLRLWESSPTDEPAPERWIEAVRLGGVALLAVPLLAVGLFPSLLAPRPATLVTPALSGPVLVAFALPLLAGYGLHLQRQAVLDRFRSAGDDFAVGLALGWLHRGLGWVAVRAGSLVRGAVELAEGEGYVAWTALVLILMYLFVAR